MPTSQSIEKPDDNDDDIGNDHDFDNRNDDDNDDHIDDKHDGDNENKTTTASGYCCRSP